ncbi:translation initiation factor IF-2 N-terminal domain-containing protein, partial [Tessaracoccus lapidicaptus]|uniref:translation initiation factor IF-2 N-terminal domain-containing protein n=1 Tax=Tessaracoccus lapidicaptus TaxID=1427523 RepID=UPI000B15E902
MAKPRVHEIAKEIGKTSKDLLAWLGENGEYVRGPSSTLEAPVVRRIREAFTSAPAAPAAQPAPSAAPKPTPAPSAPAAPAPSAPSTPATEAPRPAAPAPRPAAAPALTRAGAGAAPLFETRRTETPTLTPFDPSAIDAAALAQAVARAQRSPDEQCDVVVD